MGYPANNDGVSLWQMDAVCIGADPAIFESDGKDERFNLFCHNCPVKQDCLEYAVIYNLQGVWGGTTDKERRRFKPLFIKILRGDAEESGLYNPRLKV